VQYFSPLHYPNTEWPPGRSVIVQNNKPRSVKGCLSDQTGSSHLCLVQIEDSSGHLKTLYTSNQCCATVLNPPGGVYNYLSCSLPCANARALHPCLMQKNASVEELMGNTMPPSEELRAPFPYHPRHSFICMEGLHILGIHGDLQGHRETGHSCSYKHGFFQLPFPKGK
jgi:hypothetical protein